MISVTIRRLEATYRLPARPEKEPPEKPRPEKERLDDVLRQVLESGLESALERAGVRPWEQVCIRRLHVPVRLNLAMPDGALLEAWVEALANGLLRVRNAGPSANLVLYRSRVDALFDVAVGVATDRFESVWAWRLAGVWRGPDSPDGFTAAAEWVAAMCQSPEAIAPLLEAVAASARPAAIARGLLRRLTAQHWRTLAHAALSASNISTRVLEETDQPGTSEITSLALRAVGSSALARAARASAAPALQTPEVRRAIAALIALRNEPGALQRQPAIVQAVADVLHPAAFPSLEAEPATTPGRDTQPAPAVLLPEERAFTRFGGLLFLLRLLPVDDLLSAFDPRPFRWVLHQLALHLIAAEADDPAVLAFAGLPPGAEPPSHANHPPTDAEEESLRSVAAAMEKEAADLLDDPHPLPFLCLRSAEVVADPGWIEIRFPLREVSTVIRRSGLDLDPGWLPWLGVVMRFVYE